MPQITATKRSDELPVALQGTDEGALLVVMDADAAGGRAGGSTDGADHQVHVGEWKSLTIATNATGDITIHNGPAVVRMVRYRKNNDAGVAFGANTAGIILVKDGTTVKEGAAAGVTPGSAIYDGLEGVQFRTSFIINFASGTDNPASNGRIEVLWRPMPDTVTW